MKIGKMEGSPEEIRDFFQNNGLNIADYLERLEPSLKAVWFIVPVILVIASLSWLTLLTPTHAPIQTFVFLIGCGGGIWLAVDVQIRFKNTWAAVFVAVGTVLIMLVAIGMVTPREMIQHLKELKK
jgi:energy-coupling factor transporter transmembrane protein EcfT